MIQLASTGFANTYCVNIDELSLAQCIQVTSKIIPTLLTLAKSIENEVSQLLYVDLNLILQHFFTAVVMWPKGISAEI